MTTKPTYIDVIAEHWPALNIQANGDPTVYENLVSDEPLPTQAELDEQIPLLTHKWVWKEIQDLRDIRKASGVRVGSIWIHSDDTSRIQQIALVMFGANMPAGIMWKTMSGSFVPMTPTLAMQIFQAIAAQDQAIFTRAEIHRQAMMASAEPENYDYSTGWPQTYAESLLV